MPYQVSWYVPGHVILARMYGVVTIEDITKSNDEYMKLLHSVEGRVHTLADLSDVEKFPLNIPQIMKAMKVESERETGWMLIVQKKPNPLLQYVAAMVGQISVKKIRFRILSDIPSAVQFLLQQDPTLDPKTFPALTQQETSV
ncbi:MAG TPA: hypothetical protein VK003_20095 [Oceanobacillus sp.]|nr:hypothetical protein [Oceanobacillus sp.]